MPGHGGRREGAGRPSALQQEQKREKQQARLNAAEERRQAAVTAAEEHLFLAAEKGETWAVKEVLDREKGKAAIRQAQHADTEIVIQPRFPVKGKIAIGQKMWDYADVVRACKAYRPEDVIEEEDERGATAGAVPEMAGPAST